MPSWPASLPQYFEVDGASLDPMALSTVIETESGEPLTRLRFTGDMDDFSGSVQRMTREQTNDLLNFWRNDLKRGTLRFTWNHPLTNEAVEFLMLAPPSITPMSGEIWRVGLRLRSMPA